MPDTGADFFKSIPRTNDNIFFMTDILRKPLIKIIQFTTDAFQKTQYQIFRSKIRKRYIFNMTTFARSKTGSVK